MAMMVCNLWSVQRGLVGVGLFRAPRISPRGAALGPICSVMAATQMPFSAAGSLLEVMTLPALR